MKLFISYSHEDTAFVHELASKLRNEGQHEVWIDERLIGGQMWWDTILDNIEACDCFVAILTPKYITSHYSSAELDYALALKKPILPVMFKTVDLPSVLKAVQYVNVGGLSVFESLYRCDQSLHRIEINKLKGEYPPLTAIPMRPTIPEDKVDPIEKILLPPFEWCEIPHGFVSLEDASRSEPPGTSGGNFEVPAFSIAKYPITNAQYHVFMSSPDGGRNHQWWNYSKEAISWLEQHNPTRFRTFSGDDLPRTDITWFEAVAFCRWLSHKSEWVISLPTEQQWQRASQGDDNRKFPWGNQFDGSRCNFNSKGVTPVTQFPSGASQFGVMDMSGNVWEWCLTEWGTDNTNLLGKRLRVLRGGSWNNYDLSIRSAYRYRLIPNNHDNLSGFRIANIL